MAKIYYRAITKAGSTMTLSDVNERWRDEVKEMLLANGYEHKVI